MTLLNHCLHFTNNKSLEYNTATWRTFQPKIEKIKKYPPTQKEIPYISVNGTFKL